MKRRYYFLVTADEYELPMYVETSWRKLSKASHIPVATLALAWSRSTIIRKKYKVEVVNFPKTFTY